MNRPVKYTFWTAAFIGTAALAAYIVDRFDPSKLRIAKLRLRAWKACRDLPYSVSLRRRTANLAGVAGSYPPYWTWVSGDGGELGPLDALDFEEALEISRRQCKERTRKRGRKDSPAPHDPPPLVSGAKLAHRMSFTPLDGDRMRIDCTCGQWHSRPTEEGHHFENGCPSCDDVMREWEEHAGTVRPQPLPPEPIQPGVPLTAGDAARMYRCEAYEGMTGGLCRRCGEPADKHPWFSALESYVKS